MYQSAINGVSRMSDGAWVGLQNPTYLTWLAKGNAPTPYIAPPEAEKPPKLTKGQARVNLAGVGFTPAQVDALITVVAAIEA